MKRSQVLQEIRKMRFEELYELRTEKRLTEAQAAMQLGVHERTFRRWSVSVNCYARLTTVIKYSHF